VPNGAKQVTTVLVDHDVVRHVVPPIALEVLGSDHPKLTPETVTEAVGASVGLLTSVAVSVGASNVNETDKVPGVLSTNTVTVFAGPAPATSRHPAEVSVVHDTVLHAVFAMIAVEDRST